MRLIGLLDKRHFQPSRLGRFFLIEGLPPSPLLLYLQNYVTELFFQSNLDKIPEDIVIEAYFITCKWYYQLLVDKHQKYSPRKIEIFRHVAKVSFRIQDFNQEFRRREQLLTNSITGLTPVHTPCSLELKNLTKPPIKPQKGLAAIKVLTDINTWMETVTKENKKFYYQEPFFNIHQWGQKNPTIDVSTYSRVVTRLMKRKLAKLDRNYFRQLKEIPTIDLTIIDLVKKIRRNLRLIYITVHSNRKTRVLIFQNYRKLGRPFKYLAKTCGECIYLERQRKRDCLLFTPLETIQSQELIPEAVKAIYQE